jgi:hypothetical protein
MILPESLDVEVTDEDIREGVPCSNYRCPLGRAVRRLVGEGRNVYIGFRYLMLDGEMYVGGLAAETFTNNFDSGRPVQSCRLAFKLRTSGETHADQ